MQTATPPPAAVLRERLDQGMPLIARIARHLRRRYGDVAEHDELVSIGYEGLCAAARTYDPSFGVPFERYAWRRIRGHMLNKVHRQLRHAYLAPRRSMMPDDPEVAGDSDAICFGDLRAYCDAVAAGVAMRLMGSETGAMATTDPEQALDRARLRAMLCRALGSIDPELARVAVAHATQDQQLKHIAEQSGTSYRTVRRRHRRALIELGKVIRAEHETPTHERSARHVAARHAAA